MFTESEHRDSADLVVLTDINAIDLWYGNAGLIDLRLSSQNYLVLNLTLHWWFRYFTISQLKYFISFWEVPLLFCILEFLKYTKLEETPSKTLIPFRVAKNVEKVLKGPNNFCFLILKNHALNYHFSPTHLCKFTNSAQILYDVTNLLAVTNITYKKDFKSQKLLLQSFLQYFERHWKIFWNIFPKSFTQK